MSDKGILSKELEVKIANELDELIKLNGFLEIIDGKAFQIILQQIDDNFAEKIPEPYKAELKEMIVTIYEEKDYEAAVNDAMDFLDSLIDVPLLDDESEAMLFRGLATIIFAIIAKLNTKKE